MSLTGQPAIEGVTVYLALGLAITAAVVGLLLVINQLTSPGSVTAQPAGGSGLPRVLLGAGIVLGFVALLQAASR